MKLKIVISHAAGKDLDIIADYITERAGRQIAHRVIDAIERTFNLLAEYPGIGTAQDYGPEFDGLRMFPVSRYPNYLIFFQAIDRSLIIRRVLHGAMDIEAIFTLG